MRLRAEWVSGVFSASGWLVPSQVGGVTDDFQS
jgi:hypothetical protein